MRKIFFKSVANVTPWTRELFCYWLVRTYNSWYKKFSFLILVALGVTFCSAKVEWCPLRCYKNDSPICGAFLGIVFFEKTYTNPCEFKRAQCFSLQSKIKFEHLSFGVGKKCLQEKNWTSGKSKSYRLKNKHENEKWRQKTQKRWQENEKLKKKFNSIKWQNKIWIHNSKKKKKW